MKDCFTAASLIFCRRSRRDSDKAKLLRSPLKKEISKQPASVHFSTISSQVFGRVMPIIRLMRTRDEGETSQSSLRRLCLLSAQVTSAVKERPIFERKTSTIAPGESRRTFVRWWESRAESKTSVPGGAVSARDTLLQWVAEHRPLILDLLRLDLSRLLRSEADPADLSITEELIKRGMRTGKRLFRRFHFF